MTVPPGIRGLGEMDEQDLLVQLDEAAMSVKNLVKVPIFSSREFAAAAA